MNIDELKPGRELDALVAERVMHRSKKHMIIECNDPYYTHCRICHKDNSEWSLEATECEENPPYSTNIADAWEVVEKLYSMGIGYCVERTQTADQPTVYFMPKQPSQKSLIQFVEDMKRWSSLGETLPHAICLGALKILETQE